MAPPRNASSCLSGRCRAVSILSAVILCLLHTPHVGAAGNGMALGGLQDLPLVAWQFDESNSQIIGSPGGVESFPVTTGVPPYNSSLIDCVISHDGKKAYVATSDYFLLQYNLSSAGPVFAKQIVVGRQTASAQGFSFQSIEISPNGGIIALCGTVFAKAGFYAPHGALWLFSPATGRIAAYLTSSTLEFCVSASFCDDGTILASFQDLTTFQNVLKVFKTRRGAGGAVTWVQYRQGHNLAGASRVVSQVACAGSFAAVTRGVQAPIQVDSWTVPGLAYQGTWTGRSEASAFVISAALDQTHRRLLVRTNSSVYLVPYNRFGRLAKAASFQVASPCVNCHTSSFFTYFGVHSAGVTIPRFGTKAYLTGPLNQILVLNLASSPPRFAAPIKVTGSKYGIGAVCLQQ